MSWITESVGAIQDALHDPIGSSIEDVKTSSYLPFLGPGISALQKKKLNEFFDVDFPVAELEAFQVSQILDPNYSLPVIYGETEIAGNVVFYDVSGDNNKYLDIVYAVAEGEIDGFYDVYMNDDPFPIFSNVSGLSSSSSVETKVASTHPLYGPNKAYCSVQVPTNGAIADVAFYREGLWAERITGATSVQNLVDLANAAGGGWSFATYSVNPLNPQMIDIEVDTVGAAYNGLKFITAVNWTQTTYPYLLMLDYYEGVLLGGDDVSYIEGWFYTGTSTQAANSLLISAHPSTTSETGETIPGWTSAHTLKNVVYVVIRFTYNADLFQGGIPDLKFKIKGRKVFDPRTSTTVYSTNNAVCLYDYLTNSTYSYSKKLDTSLLDTASFITAANLCDVLRSGEDIGGSPITYKTYEISAIVDTNKRIKDNVPAFLQSMRANFPYVDGKYFLNIETAGSSVVSFSEADIIGEINLESTNKNTRYNKVIVSFTDKERHYEVGEAPFDNATYLAEDNGEILETRLSVPYIDFYPRAFDLAELTMNLSRAGKIVSFNTTMKALKAIPGDIVDLSYDSFGWINKLFRVISLTFHNTGLAEVVLAEHDNAFYSLTTKRQRATYTQTRLQRANNVRRPINLSLLSDGTTVYTNVDGQLLPRIYASWLNNDDYTYEYNIYFKKSTASNFRKAGSTKDTAFYIPDVKWNTSYDVAVTALNGIGLESKKTVATISTANPLIGAVYNYPDVTGLELVGTGTNEGLGNATEYTGKDIKLQWRLASSNVAFEFGSNLSEQMGGAGGVLPFSLNGYTVEIYHPGDTLARQKYFVTQPNFVYSLDKNIEDGNGTPSRTVTFKVYAEGSVADVGVSGSSEIPATLTVTNPAPDLPSGITLTASFRTLYLEFTEPSDADYKGVRVWIGTSSGFTRDSSTLAYQGSGNKIVIDKLGSGTELSSGVTYYVYMQTYDDFGYEGTESIELSATTIKIAGEFDIESQSIKTAQIGLAQITNALIDSLQVDKLTSGNFTGKYINITTGGNIRSGQTAYNTGTGFWIGDDAGTAKLSIGSSAGNYLTWNGSALNLSGDLLLDTNNYWKKSTNTFKIGDGTSNIQWNGSVLTVKTLKTASTGKRIELNPSSDNEIHFYGDRGDGTIEQLAAIGINTSGTDTIVGYFGSVNTSRIGVLGVSSTSIGVKGYSSSGYGVYGYSEALTGVYGSSLVIGVAGYSPAGTGVEASANSGTGLFATSTSGLGLEARSLSTTRSALMITPKSNAVDPTSPSMGEVYVTSTGILKFYNGTSWKTVSLV